MKKVFVLVMVLFLAFSLESFSMNNSGSTANSINTEQSGKGKAKIGRKPRKAVSKKKVHTKGPKTHNSKKSGKRIII